MIWTIPNFLTLFRILVIPVLIALFFIQAPWAVWTTLGLYILGALTDYIDGALARRTNQVSEFGKLLDPIADKIFVASVMIMLIASHRIEGLWSICVVIILLREFLVSGLREYLAPKKGVKLPVTKLAKWKTACQMIALGFLILTPLSAQAHQAGLLLILLATVLTVITGWIYLKSALIYILKN